MFAVSPILFGFFQNATMFANASRRFISPKNTAKNGTLEHSLIINNLSVCTTEHYRTLQNNTLLDTVYNENW